MPFHLNQVNIAGTMTRDAEVKYTPRGTAVANISLAINRTWKDDDGVKQEETTFVEVTAWGRTAEIIGEYTGKGHTIMVEGRLKLDQWEDKNSGGKRSKLSVVCEKFHFVSKPKSEEDDQDQPPPRREQRQQPQTGGYGKYQKPQQPIDPDLDAADGDDIPF